MMGAVLSILMITFNLFSVAGKAESDVDKKQALYTAQLPRLPATDTLQKDQTQTSATEKNDQTYLEDESLVHDFETRFNNESFEQGEHYALNLIGIFPPKKHFYIQLGQSHFLTNTFVRELLTEEQLKTGFLDVPIIGIRFISDFLNRTRKAGEPKFEDAFWSKIVPAKEVLQNRELVISRGMFMGHSMAPALESLLSYLQRHNYPRTLSFFMTFSNIGDAHEIIDAFAEQFSDYGFDLKIAYTIDPIFFNEFTAGEFNNSRGTFTNANSAFARFHPFTVRIPEYDEAPIFNLDFVENPRHTVLKARVQQYVSKSKLSRKRNLTFGPSFFEKRAADFLNYNVICARSLKTEKPHLPKFQAYQPRRSRYF